MWFGVIRDAQGQDKLKIFQSAKFLCEFIERSTSNSHISVHNELGNQ